MGGRGGVEGARAALPPGGRSAAARSRSAESMDGQGQENWGTGHQHPRLLEWPNGGPEGGGGVWGGGGGGGPGTRASIARRNGETEGRKEQETKNLTRVRHATSAWPRWADRSCYGGLSSGGTKTVAKGRRQRGAEGERQANSIECSKGSYAGPVAPYSDKGKAPYVVGHRTLLPGPRPVFRCSGAFFPFFLFSFFFLFLFFIGVCLESSPADSLFASVCGSSLSLPRPIAYVRGSCFPMTAPPPVSKSQPMVLHPQLVGGLQQSRRRKCTNPSRVGT